MNEEPNKNLESKSPNNLLPNNGGFSSFQAPLGSTEKSQASTDFISLAEASKETGYHQDYLGFLCRNGKLKGFKIGRNWVTTKADLDEFIKNYKNGINEVTDETGAKIQVHVEKPEQASAAELNLVPAPQNLPMVESSMQTAPSVPAVVPASAELSHLRKEIIVGLEEKVKAIDESLAVVESKIAKQNELLEKEQAIIQEHEKEIARQSLHEKFSSNINAIEPVAIAALAYEEKVPTAGNFFTAEKVKELYKSFAKPVSNLPVVWASGAIAVAGLLGTILLLSFVSNKVNTNPGFEPKIVYKQEASSSTPGTTISQIDQSTKIINQVLGLNQSQVYSLIDDRLNQYLAEGKFRGDPGLQGPQGVAGTSPALGQNGSFINGPAAPVGVFYPNPNNNGGGTIGSVTAFSAESGSINNLHVSNLTVSTSATLPNTTATHLSVSDLTVGNCVQAGADGALTTTSLPCGTGTGGGGSGNGTVATGTAGSFAYYAAAEATVTPQSVLFISGSNIGVGTSTPAQTLSVAGNFRLTGALFDTNNASGTLGMVLQTTGTGTQWVATSTLGLSASLTGGAAGYAARWLNDSTLATSTVIDNGTVTGVNASSSSVSFLVQGTTTLDPFKVNSSTGTSLFVVKANGNVGIGTTTPWEQLTVGSGSLAIGNSTQVLADGVNALVVGQVTGTSTINAASDGSLALGIAQGGAYIRTDDRGSFAGGSVSGNDGAGNVSYIKTADLGAQAFGFASDGGNIVANFKGSSAGGYANGSSGGSDSFILANDVGSQAFGTALSGGYIKTDSQGAVAFGYAANTGYILSDYLGALAMGFASGNDGLGNKSRVYSDDSGALAYGFAKDGGQINSYYSGSFAGGQAEGSNGSGTVSLIQGNSNAAFAYGYAQNGGSITASGRGSLAFGYDVVDGESTLASGLGSFALGSNVQATGNHSFALGQNFSNSTANSFKVGWNALPTLTVLDTKAGINSTTPIATLSVVGTSSSPTLPLLAIASSSGASYVTVLNNGNVGIGTSSPVQLLTVEGNIYSDNQWGTGPTIDSFNPAVQDRTVLLWDSSKGAFWAGEWDDASVTAASIGNASAVFGENNLASGYGSFVGGGKDNFVTNDYSGILGGKDNRAAAQYSGILGGSGNTITNGSTYSAIVGGLNNTAADLESFLGGGASNYVEGLVSAAIGGNGNYISANNASIIGGDHNTTTGSSAFTIGGQNNIVSGNYSGAFGRKITVSGIGSFGVGLDGSPYTISQSNVFGILGGRLGVGSTSPTATVVVQGTTSSPTLPLFVVASSSNSEILTVTSLGNVNIATLTASSLVVTDANKNLASSNININNIISSVSTGTTGNIFNISTSTNSLVINIPFSSSVNTGQLQSSDWLTFNNKLSGSLSANQIPYATGASSTAGSNNFIWNPNSNTLAVTGSTTISNLLTVGGSLSVTGPVAFSAATTTINGVTYYWPSSVPLSSKILQSDASGNLSWVSDQTGGGGSVSGGVNGFVTTWIGTSTLSSGIIMDNGSVAGVNATSSSVSFLVKGTGALNPFQVNTSTGSSLFAIGLNGSTTLSSLGTGVVRSSSGSLFNGAVNLDSSDVSGVLAVSNGGIGTTTLGNLTVGSNLSISGGQQVLIGTSTSISLGAGVIAAVSTGTTGNIFNISTSTNSLVINIPFSSSVNTGQLQSSDWLTFNNKLSGSLTANQIPYATGASSTAGSNNFVWLSTPQSLGVNSTTPYASLVVQASSSTQTLPIFVVASTSGLSFLTVNTNGSTTLSSLTTGPVYSTSLGALYTNATTGTGLAVQQTSPTLITPILGVASSTALSVSGNLYVTGQTTLAVASSTALTVSGPLFVTSQSTLATASSTALTVSGLTYLATTTNSGTLTVTGSTTISSLGAGCVNSTSGGALFVATCGASGSGAVGLVARWSSATALTTGLLFDDGSVAGVNATTTGVAFTVQGATLNDSAANTSISRGVYINPSITKATDYRGLEVAGYTFNLSSTTAISQVYGTLHNQIIVNTTTVASLAGASNVYITGAPKSSSNLTITSSTALTIVGGVVSSTTNAYGLFLTAPTGATGSNYAAIFAGGNVGIGSTAPVSTLGVGGTLTVTGQTTLAVASSTALTVSGPLFVTSQSTLATASSTALTVSGLTYLATTTNSGTLTVTGSTTLSSLTTGPVYSTSLGALYTNATTGTGLAVQQTSPTLITPILGVASSTALSVSGNLYVTGQTTLAVASSTALTVSGPLFVTSQSTLATASSTALTVSGLTYLATTTNSGTLTVTGSSTFAGISASNIFNTGATSCTNVQTTSAGLLQCNNTTYLTTIGSGNSGFVSIWNGSNTLAQGLIRDNGTVAGINATSSTITFNLQGTSGSTNTIFNIASSTGVSILAVTANQRVGIGSTTPNSTLVVQGTSTSPTLDVFTVASSSNSVLFSVAANGSTTLSSLTTGPVYSTSLGALYTNATTGTGLAVQQTSPTLITPILGVASSTALSVSGNLYVTGQTTLAVASSTALTVSGPLFVTSQSTLATASSTALTVSGLTYLATTTNSGTLTVTGSTTISSLGAGCVNSTSGGALFVATCGASGSGAVGLVARWSSATALTTGLLFDDGSVAGVNATTTGVAFTVQGATLNDSAANTSISRGVYINPSITKATDYRGLEVAGYTFNLSSTTAISQVYGTLHNQIIVNTTTVASLAGASNVYITGAPKSSSNLTITSSTALTIVGGVVSSTTNAYGLFLTAPTGATGSNYAAIFAGGNVGIGSTAPVSTLGVGGTLTVTGQTTLAVASSTALTVSGPLFVTSQSTLATASSTALTVSGLTYLATTTNSGTLTVTGSTTLSSLTTGPVYSTSLGALYTNATTGTGLAVQQTSPTLITPILGVASSTALSVSGNLYVTGQTTLAVASSTALTVSGPLFVTSQSTLATASSTALTVSGLTYLATTTNSGTLTVTGSSTISSLGAGLVRSTSGGALFIGQAALASDVSGVLAVTNGGIGTTTLGNLTVGSNLSVTGGQSVLIGTSTSISLGAGVIAAVSTGTTGNIFNISTSTNSLVINIPFSSSVNTGQLQSSDWLTFNNKLSGSLTNGQIVYATGASSTASTSNFLWDNTTKSLTINSSTPFAASLYVVASSSSQTLPIFVVASTSGSSFLTVGTSGNVGIGTATPSSLLQVAGDIQLGSKGVGSAANLIFNTGSTTNQTTVKLLATTSLASSYILTLPTTTPSAGKAIITDANGNLYWGTAGGASASGTAGNIQFSDGSSNLNANQLFQWDNTNYRLAIGTTSAISKLQVEGLTSASGATAVAGIYASTTLALTTNSGFEFGNRFVSTISGTATGTYDGMLIRTVDNTSAQNNVVRALEVQGFSGTNNGGINTGIATFGHTFGIQGFTDGLSASVAVPAAIYGELDHPTSGNAIRAYSGTATTASLLSVYQETSAFTGTGLLMNFGNGGGSFSSGKFIDLQNASSSVFVIDSVGKLGINSSTPGSALTVVGTSSTPTLPLLTVASSTGSVLFQVAANGSTTISSLNAASCDVKATTLGSLYCGLDATGASTGNAAWTIGNGLIYNATSTDLVGIGTITPTTTLFVQGKGGTNPFAIASSTGTQLVTVTQAGNVGIGTTTPLGRFVVQGPDTSSNTTVFQVLNSAGTSLIQTNDDGSTTFNGPGGSSLQVTSTGISVANGVNTNYANFGGWFSISQASNGGINLGSGHFVAFKNNATTNIQTTAAAGDVALGASGNLGQLEINNLTTGTWRDLIVRNYSANTTSTSTVLTVQGLGGKDIVDISSSTGTSILHITQAGFVGIGTTTPTNTLSVVGSGSTNPFVVASSTGAKLVEVNTAGTLTITPPGGTATVALQLGSSGLNAYTNGVINLATNGGIDNNASGAGTWQVGVNSASLWSGYLVKWTNGNFYNSTVDLALARNSVGVLEVNNGSAGTWRDLIVRNYSANTTSTSTVLTVQGLAGKDIVDVSSSTGSSIFHITQGGYVGIGTTTPVAALAFASSTTAAGGINFGDATANLYRSAAGTIKTDGALYLQGALTLNTNTVVNADSAISRPSGGSIFLAVGSSGVRSDADLYLVSDTNNDDASSIIFGSNNAAFASINEYMRIDANGRVGIGSSTINATLVVQGTTSTPTLPVLVVASSTGAQLLTVLANGNVGIGSTTPSVPLVVVGSTTITSLSAANCDVKSTTFGNLYCGTDATGASTGNAAWTIGVGLIYNATSTDLVGIGTITPTTTLFIQGKGGTNPFAIASSTGTQLLTVTQAGNVGIGTTTPWEKLTVENGSVAIAGTSQVYADGNHSFTVGDATGLGYINASGNNSLAVGKATGDDGLGNNSNISSLSDGSFALGSVTGGAYIHGGAGGAGGAFAGGAAFDSDSTGTVSSIVANADGAFAYGNAISGGQIQASNYGAHAFGYAEGVDGLGNYSYILSNDLGSLAFGAAKNGAYIFSDWHGSFSGGFASDSDGAGNVSYINSEASGSMAYGDAENGGYIKTNGKGSIAQGYASDSDGNGNVSYILANQVGAIALGHAEDGAYIKASQDGSFAGGSSIGVSASGTLSYIKTDNSGALAFGEAYGGGYLLSSAPGNVSLGSAEGDDTNGHASYISSNNNGALAFGYALNGGYIFSDDYGSLAGGYANYRDGAGHLSYIQAERAGSLAFGEAATGAFIKANGAGSVALGYGDTYGESVLTGGVAAFALGQNVQANSNNSYALGRNIYTSTTNSFALGWGTTTLEVLQSSVGINTTSPISTLAVVGTSSLNSILTVASSSGASYLTVLNNGNVGIGTTTPGQSLVVVGSTTITSLTAGCVNSTANGGLYSAACATGGGNSAWTIGSGLIYNATSTDLVGIGTITPTTTLFLQGKGGVNPFAIASSTGTQLLTVTQAGFVGIGTATPLANLSIVGVPGQASTTQLFAVASSTSLLGGSYASISGRGQATFNGRAIDPEFVAETRGTTPGTTLDGAIDVFVSGKYAYVANFGRSSLSVIDISNPANPTFIAETQGPTPGVSLASAVSVFVSGKYAYVANQSRDSLAVIDISNPANPTFIAETQGTTPGTTLDGASSVFVSGKYAYVANQSRDSLAVIDISNPANPTFIAETRGPTPGTSLDAASDVFVSGKYAYVANLLRDSLAVIDISNPANPTFIAETQGTTPGTTLDGASSVFVSGKYAYVANQSRDSIAVIDISNPANPTFIAETQGTTPGTTLDGADGVFVSGKYAYVANFIRDSIAVIDISNPSSPTFVAETRGPTPGTSLDSARTPFVSGKYAYLPNLNRDSLAVIDIGGLEASTLYAGNIQTDSIQVDALAVFNAGINTSGGINVGNGGIYSNGPVAISPSFDIASATTLTILDINPSLTASSTASITPMTALYVNKTAPYLNLAISTNTITSLYNNYSGLTVATGTVTNFYGQYIAAPTVTGTLTNKYSIVTENGSGRAGFGTTTPSTSFAIQGAAGSTDLLDIASSTGSSILRVAVNGNLGIGTTTPGRTLTVVGDIRATGILYDSTNSAGTNGYVLQTSGTGYSWVATSTLGFSGSGVTDGQNGYVPYFTSATTLASSTIITNGTVVGINATSSTITFNLQGNAGTSDIFDVSSSTGISVLRVTSNQRVGIGSTTPNATLVVQGTSTSPTLPVFVVASSSNSSLFTVLANGNVGISSTTPASKLSIISTVNGSNALQIENNNGQILLVSDSGLITYGPNLNSSATVINFGNNISGASGANPFFLINPSTAQADGTPLFQVRRGASSNYLTVMGSGFVEIGTTTVTDYLSVSPTFNIASASASSTLSLLPTINSNASITAVTSYKAENVVPLVSLLNNTTTITSLYGRFGGLNLATGTVTTFYGEYLQAPTVGVGTLTNKYAIVTESGAGNVGFGSTTPTSAYIAIQGAAGSTDLLNIASSTGSSILRVTASGSVGIGSSTPNATLVVEGVSTSPTLDVFRVASSTNSVLLSVAANGSTTVANLNAANCVVNATTNGSLYCGTGGAGVSGGTNGYVARFTSDTAVTKSSIIDDGTNVGINASSSTVTFNLQGNAGTSDILNVASSTGTSVLKVTANGRVAIGTSTPISALHVEGSTSATGANAVGAIFASSTLAQTTAGGFEYGNRFLNTVNGTASGTFDGLLIRMTDSMSNATNTTRGLEVQADSGTNTLGINTGILGFGKTFGIQGITSGLAGGQSTPAGVYAELDNATVGNAFRAYSNTSTSATLVQVYQETSAFTGTGLLMDLGNGTGSFASGNFINLKNAGAAKFTVAASGTLAVNLQVGGANTYGVCHDTNGGGVDTLTDCTTTVNADYQELYPTSPDVEWGDVLVASKTLTATTTKGDSFSILEKAAKGYDANILGIASNPEDSGDFNTIGNNLSSTTTQYPVALKGRVKVKVTNENGAVEVGDFLTSSAKFHGYAMKATRSGRVIGRALENFNGDSEVASSTISSGKVMVFVETGFEMINNTFVFGEDDGQLSQATSTLSPNPLALSPGFLIDQRGSGNLLQVQQAGADRFLIANDGSIQILANTTSTTENILSVSNGSSTLFSISSVGDITTVGHIIVGKDTAGTATIKAGDNQTTITFDAPFESIPKIVATVQGLPNFFYGVATKTPTGFAIQISAAQDHDVSFDWVALAQSQDTASESSNVVLTVQSSPEPQAPNNGGSQGGGSEVPQSDSGQVSGDSTTAPSTDSTTTSAPDSSVPTDTSAPTDSTSDSTTSAPAPDAASAAPAPDTSSAPQADSGSSPITTASAE